MQEVYNERVSIQTPAMNLIARGVSFVLHNYNFTQYNFVYCSL